MSQTDTHQETSRLITASDSAIKHLHKLLENESSEVEGVRMAVKGGGCSGLSYALEFDKGRDGDHIIEIGSMRFLMDRKSAIYLKGIHLNYKEGLNGKGFVFENPNATSTCGCGESFSV